MNLTNRCRLYFIYNIHILNYFSLGSCDDMLGSCDDVLGSCDDVLGSCDMLG